MNILWFQQILVWGKVLSSTESISTSSYAWFSYVFICLFNDADNSSEYIVGLIKTRLETSLARLADVALKRNIQVGYMHTRLTVKGVLKDFLNRAELL
jgi:hypothetical protein